MPEASRFRFDGVEMVGDPTQLQVRPGPEGLTVVFDERGIEVIGADSGPHRILVWSDLRGVSVGVGAGLPGDHAVIPVDLVAWGHPIRFLMPVETPRPVQVDAFEQWLAGRSGPSEGPVPGLSAAPPRLPPPRPQPFPPPPYGRPPGGDPGDRTSWLPPSWPAPGSVPAGHVPAHRGRTPGGRRNRRWATLVVGLVLIAAGTGLAIALAGHDSHRTAVTPAPPQASPDQHLADQLMLTQSDLPEGWRVDSDTDSGDSQRLRTGERTITGAFARCVGINGEQAAVVLGGQAADQTAQVSSPVFVAPSSAANPGFFMELQTAANIVRTHHDEQSDFSLFSEPRYPECAAQAVASELQLGENDASGKDGRPGPATASTVALPAPAGEQLSALIVTFTISDQTNEVPVEVEAVTLGSARIEANLQAFAIGGQIPKGVLAHSVATFEERIAAGGKTAQV